ncbi:MAG: hypothetical protein ACI8WB_000365 [Phenylobacterium sp.]|jgi:hypothetical protein
MFSPITVSNDTAVSETFNRVNPAPFDDASPAVVSEKTGDLTGFFQDRVSISPLAQQKSQASQQINNSESQKAAPAPTDESISVSSSIGRSASSDNLNRQQAVAIYQKIAALV